MKIPAFCVECELSFDLVDRSHFPSTCCGCVAKLAESYFCCDRCKRVIEVGEKFHLEWVCYCLECYLYERRVNGLSKSHLSTAFPRDYARTTPATLPHFWEAML